MPLKRLARDLSRAMLVDLVPGPVYLHVSTAPRDRMSMSSKRKTEATEVELSEAQLEALVTRRAEELGLTLTDALRAAKSGTLPRTVDASDLEILSEMLDRARARGRRAS